MNNLSPITRAFLTVGIGVFIEHPTSVYDYQHAIYYSYQILW